MGPQAVILKLCLALACLTMRNLGLKTAASFYKEALRLLATCEDSETTILLIQGWILQFQYLYATGQMRSARGPLPVLDCVRSR